MTHEISYRTASEDTPMIGAKRSQSPLRSCCATKQSRSVRSICSVHEGMVLSRLTGIRYRSRNERTGRNGKGKSRRHEMSRALGARKYGRVPVKVK